MNSPKGVKCGLPSLSVTLTHVHNTPSGDRHKDLHGRPNMNLWKARWSHVDKGKHDIAPLVIPWFLSMTLDNTIVTK